MSEIKSASDALQSHIDEMNKEHEEKTGDDFITELKSLINKHSMGSGSNTPDFLLAKYLYGCLRNYDVIVSRRDDWYKS